MFTELFTEAKKDIPVTADVLRKLYQHQGKTLPQGFGMSPKAFEYATNGGYWFGFKPVGTEGKGGKQGIWIEDTDVKEATGMKIKEVLLLMKKAGAIKSSWQSFLK